MTAAREVLSAALQSFGHDPVRAGKVLRQALDADTAAFLRTITWNSAFDVNDRGFRYALILLRNSDLLIPAIAGPALTNLEQARGLTKCMLVLDPNFVNSLLEAVFIRPDLRDTRSVLRILDLIGEFADRLANWRGITRLYQDGDPRIKAKCATLLIRFRFDHNLTEARFEEGDSRVRASIVEALSDRRGERPDPVSARLLETALTDPNNRVAGNACLALYQAGDARALACLAAMLSRESESFQLTAAWVMGKTRDIRFAGLLAGAIRSGRPNLRTAAFKSIGCLDRIPAAAGPEAPSLIATSAPADADHTELWLRAVDHNGRFLRELRSVDCFLFAGPAPVLHYSFESRSTAGNVSVAIVFPVSDLPLAAAFLPGIAEKPRGQAWAFSAYGQTIRPQQQVPAPVYEADSRRLSASVLAGPPGTISVGRSCRSLLRLPHEAGERHLVLFLDGSSEGDLEFQRLRAQCSEGRIRLHCFPLPGFKSCDAGMTHRTPLLTEAGLAAWWSAFCASLQECYIVRTASLNATVDGGLQMFLRDTTVTPARFSRPERLFRQGECAT